MSERIALAAEKIAKDERIMGGYREFYKGKGFFLTRNQNLFGAKGRPPKFPSTSNGFSKKWVDRNWFITSQRKYLLALAGFSENKNIRDSDYERIKEAYDKWTLGYLVVFYGTDAKWACNLFVGEALFESGYGYIMSGGINICLLNRYGMEKN